MSTLTTTPLLDFYARLGENDALFEEFERDPKAALERAGFSGDALDTLLDGDLDTIRVTLGDEMRSTPRSEYGGGEHTPDEGEHTPDDDDEGGGEHTPDQGGEHTPDDDEGGGEHTPDEGGEHHPDDDDDQGGEHTGDDDGPGEHTPDE